LIFASYNIGNGEIARAIKQIMQEIALMLVRAIG
jgi:hypothetical protein